MAKVTDKMLEQIISRLKAAQGEGIHEIFIVCSGNSGIQIIASIDDIRSIAQYSLLLQDLWREQIRREAEVTADVLNNEPGH